MLKTWFDTAPQLIDVAMGRTPADTVVRSGRWVKVHAGGSRAMQPCHFESYVLPSD